MTYPQLKALIRAGVKTAGEAGRITKMRKGNR
jgi:hypothetical protein